MSVASDLSRAQGDGCAPPASEHVAGRRFYLDTVHRLLEESWLSADDRVLVVAGADLDRAVLLDAGLRNVTITNVDDRHSGDEFAPFHWSYQDAEQLGYPDRAFDVCIVHQALHHCRSPHRALLEMYRVADRGIVMFEPHETLLTRLGVRLGVGQQYECAAVAANALRWGGVQNTDVPNFVYRWTRREVHKTLAANDPTGHPRVRCFYDLRVPARAVARRGRAARMLAPVAVPAARALLRLVPRQANAIAVVADRLDPARHDLHPWLIADEHGPRADPRWFGQSAPAGSTTE